MASLHASPPLGISVWLTVETPRGVLRLEDLASVPGVAGLIMGTTDLTRDLRARHPAGREALLYALSRTVTCARAYGLAVLDGVHLDLHDAGGFGRACSQGRDLGFDGKTLIHPAQIAVANTVFAPSAAELQRARDLLAAWADSSSSTCTPRRPGNCCTWPPKSPRGTRGRSAGGLYQPSQGPVSPSPAAT